MYPRITNAWNNKIIWENEKIIDKTKNGENVTSLEVIEVDLVQYNLVDY